MAWSVLALWFHLPRLPALAAGAACALAGMAVLVVLWRGGGTCRKAGAAVAGVVAVVAMAAWWQSLAPSHGRDWADDVARLLDADVRGDVVTLRNVRNFDWESETRYTPRWETRQYDLRQLATADLVMSYWMGPHIAHTLVSFGFTDGRRLVFSLEIRKERQETFSALGGFFRSFEAVLIAADEHDIVRTRSNARGEQVYLYRLRATPAQLRTVFLAYLAEAARLQRAPAFYNTLTSNCTTILYDLARQVAPDLPLDYRLLASGHFAEYAYDHGALAPGYPFGELQRRGHINGRAHQPGADADFSRAIRAGVPGIPAREWR
ncbi:membrane protein [Pseudoduganella buxea]|uniref:Membrane protein n=2 Tax=Pseudoduganella buxea TaxID=1949069 RepID=A0ABQ1L205_9BURK|nr:membrane protein [Pseudoduganella buxea]